MLRAAENQEAARRSSQGRRFIYTDVETLVSPGFLAHDVAVGRIPISMRSLNPSDLRLLQHRVGPMGSDTAWKRWAVASSIWMVDGQSLLEFPHAITRMYRTLLHLPRVVMDILFSICTGLTDRANVVGDRLEAYCYEPYSRSLWKSLRDCLPSDERVTGIPGSHRLGLNHVQKAWIVFNEAEDEHESWLHHWQSAKFIASAHHPKGVKKISRKDESQKKSEETRRERVIDETFLKATGTLPDRAGAPRLYRAVTADDLVDEMHRWTAGEQDFHDLVVEDYKNRIRQRMEDERSSRVAEEQARLEAIEADMLDAEGRPIEIRPLVGYTPEQLLEITGTMPRRGAVVYDKSNATYVHDKYIAQNAKAGAWRPDGSASPVKMAMSEDGDDDGGRESDLQAKISGRRVSVMPKPEERD